MIYPSVQHKQFDPTLAEYRAAYSLVNGTQESAAPFGIAAYEFFDGERYRLIAECLEYDDTDCLLIGEPSIPGRLKDDQLYRSLAWLRDCGELTLTLHRDYFDDVGEGEEGFEYYWYEAESSNRILI